MQGTVVAEALRWIPAADDVVRDSTLSAAGNGAATDVRAVNAAGITRLVDTDVAGFSGSDESAASSSGPGASLDMSAARSRSTTTTLPGATPVGLRLAGGGSTVRETKIEVFSGSAVRERSRGRDRELGALRRLGAGELLGADRRSRRRATSRSRTANSSPAAPATGRRDDRRRDRRAGRGEQDRGADDRGGRRHRDLRVHLQRGVRRSLGYLPIGTVGCGFDASGRATLRGRGKWVFGPNTSRTAQACGGTTAPVIFIGRAPLTSAAPTRCF